MDYFNFLYYYFIFYHTTSFSEIAHSTPNGRFHWFRENGIIESDDVRVLLDEIDEAVSYSKQAQLLVASITDKRVGSE